MYLGGNRRWVPLPSAFDACHAGLFYATSKKIRKNSTFCVRFHLFFFYVSLVLLAFIATHWRGNQGELQKTPCKHSKCKQCYLSIVRNLKSIIALISVLVSNQWTFKASLKAKLLIHNIGSQDHNDHRAFTLVSYQLLEWWRPSSTIRVTAQLSWTMSTRAE